MTDISWRPIARPVQNDSDTLPVTINLALQQIINFDGKNEAIVISGWMTIKWNDYSLRWKPEQFGNIQTLRIPSTQIWTPDIFLYTTVDDKFDTTTKVNAVVQYDGEILYVPPVLFKSICPFNIASFPFVRVNLTAESSQGQVDAYVENAEWYLEVPCFLISCMTILGFLLSPDSGEKLTLRELEFDDKKCVLIHFKSSEITTLLSVIMFSLLLSEILPSSSTAIPIITVYFMCVMIMTAVSVVASVLILSLHHRSPSNYAMPSWVRKYICNYLAWLLHMKRPNHDLTWRAIRRRWASPKQESDNLLETIDNHQTKIPSEPLFDNTFELLSTNVINIDKEPLENQEKQHLDSILESAVPRAAEIHGPDYHQKTSNELYTCDMDTAHSELRVIISQLAILINYSRQKEKDDNESQDWQFVAMVIDRLCLVFFSIIMFLFTALTFLHV
ncbi:unnamed protein product [Rotaria sp. Silwood1]|nr:unnamed protein product [Rotaria sp. Silwood1]CAF3604165.1 unnamed protein product [Rotaria sp. Silwood1]CAF4788812.1 unnamed protein product [Rotaria sp. Silwood1]